MSTNDIGELHLKPSSLLSVCLIVYMNWSQYVYVRVVSFTKI